MCSHGGRPGLVLSVTRTTSHHRPWSRPSSQVALRGRSEARPYHCFQRLKYHTIHHVSPLSHLSSISPCTSPLLTTSSPMALVPAHPPSTQSTQTRPLRPQRTTMSPPSSTNTQGPPPPRARSTRACTHSWPRSRPRHPSCSPSGHPWSSSSRRLPKNLHRAQTQTPITSVWTASIVGAGTLLPPRTTPPTQQG